VLAVRIMDKPDDSTETTCIEKPSTHRIAPEQLRKLLSDHRNKLQETRRNLLWSAAQLKDEIAIIEATLAELTIG